MNDVDKSGLKKKLLSGAMWLTGLTLIGQLITWTISLFVIRLLSPEDYGLMAMAYIFLGFLELWSQLGVGPALIQKSKLETDDIRKAYGCVVIINLCIFLCVYFAAPLVALFFSEPRLIPIIRALTINFIFIALYFLPQSLLLREFEYRTKATIDLMANVFGGLTVLTLALLDYGVWSLVAGAIGINLFKVVAFNLLRKYHYWPMFSFSGMRDLLSFGGQVTLTRTIWYFYSQADIVIGGRLLGKELIGVYAVAMQIVSMPLEKISNLYRQIAFPAFSRIQDDLLNTQRQFLRIIKMINVVSFPVFIGIGIVAPDFVPLLFGDAWQGIIVPIQVLCFVMPLRLLATMFPPVISGFGRPEVITKNMITAILIMPAAFLIGARWGIVGLCYAWLTAFPVLFVLMSKRVLRALELKWSEFLGTFVFPVTSCLVMIIALSAFKWFLGSSIPVGANLTIIIASGLIMYPLLLMSMDRHVFSELRSMFSSR